MSGFAQVPKDFYTDANLSTVARLVGVSIIGFQFQAGETGAGQKAIAGDIGLSVRHTRRGLDELEAAGWVKVERRRKRRGEWQTNLYSFVFDRGTSMSYGDNELGRVSAGKNHGTSLAAGQGWPTTNKEEALNKGGHDMSSGDAVAVLATPASKTVNPSSLSTTVEN